MKFKVNVQKLLADMDWFLNREQKIKLWEKIKSLIEWKP